MSIDRRLFLMRSAASAGVLSLQWGITPAAIAAETVRIG